MRWAAARLAAGMLVAAPLVSSSPRLLVSIGAGPDESGPYGLVAAPLVPSSPRLLVSIVSIVSSSLWAQEPVRAFAMGDPRVGHDAPVFILPYARAEGPGHGEQPFALKAELGRVVVLAFCQAPADSATATLLRTLGQQFDSLFAEDLVVAGLLPLAQAPLAGAATGLGLGFKLLADSTGHVRRSFGVDRRELGVYVVDPAGRVAWRNVHFDPFMATSYERVRDAVRRALRR